MSIPNGWQVPRSNGRLDYSQVFVPSPSQEGPSAPPRTAPPMDVAGEDETPAPSSRASVPLTLTERQAIIDAYTRRREEYPTLSRDALVNLMCEVEDTPRSFKTVYKLVSQHEQALGQSQRRRTFLQAAQPDMVAYYNEVRPRCRRQVDAYRAVATRFECSADYVQKVIQAALKARQRPAVETDSGD